MRTGFEFHIPRPRRLRQLALVVARLPGQTTLSDEAAALSIWLITLTSWAGGAVDVRRAVLSSVLEAIGAAFATSWLRRLLFDADATVVSAITGVMTVGIYSMAHSSMPALGADGLDFARPLRFAVEQQDDSDQREAERPQPAGELVRW